MPANPIHTLLLCLNAFCFLPAFCTLCRFGQHIMGRWIPTNATQKTYYVCNWDNNDFRVNPNTCGWNPRYGEHLMYGHTQWNLQTGGHSAVCDARDNTRYSITQREKYEWKPMLCDLIPWNATQFCSLIGNRTILMIGDSTMVQTAGALTSRITTDLPRNTGCAHHIAVGTIDLFASHSSMNYVDVVNPDVLVFNTGAHCMTMKCFRTEIEQFGILHREIVSHYAKQNKSVTMLWKTMNPGHVNCSKESGGPLTDSWNHDYSTEDLYNWHIFPEQDNFARHHMVDHLGMKIIDMSPLYYRQDAHSDCLHYCLPGPVDLFGVLLLNMLHTGEI